jgi:putative membrane protein
MYQGHRFSFWRSIWWTRHSNAMCTLYATAVCCIFYFADLEWLSLGWQPVGLIGVALAFYLGFKNNSA